MGIMHVFAKQKNNDKITCSSKQNNLMKIDVCNAAWFSLFSQDFRASLVNANAPTILVFSKSAKTSVSFTSKREKEKKRRRAKNELN